LSWLGFEMAQQAHVWRVCLASGLERLLSGEHLGFPDEPAINQQQRVLKSGLVAGTIESRPPLDEAHMVRICGITEHELDAGLGSQVPKAAGKALGRVLGFLVLQEIGPGGDHVEADRRPGRVGHL
jgi:hypothetical protein